MADEKLNVSPEENPQPSLFDAGPEGAPAQDAPTPEPPAPENIPEQAAVDAPVQDAPAGAPGEVSVSADQIEKLMAEQRAAGRAEVEKNEPPEPEQPPTPAPEDKAAGEKEPEKKGKAAKEKTPEPDKSKGRRGRKPKEEKRGPVNREGRGLAVAAQPRLIRRPRTSPRPHLETFCPKEPGLGRLPNKHFCGPAAQQKFRVWPHPNCLPFVRSPIHGANMGGVVSLYLRGLCGAEGGKMAADVVD